MSTRSRTKLEKRARTHPTDSGWWRAVLLLLSLLCPAGCGSKITTPNDQSDSTQSQLSAAPKSDLIPITDMVLIKAGSFVRLRHSVTLTGDFWLGKYEVTQAEYAALMGQNPSYFKDAPNHPVEKLSYFDAVAYCSALSKREQEAGRLPPGYEYRLPSEAEWEYACRAGTTHFFSFGDANADQYAWTAENSESTTHPVGQKLPNAWGLHDMHGNVWEWCLDWFAPYPRADLKDPAGPAEGQHKVFRGGSWYHDLDMARAGNRFMMSPSNGIYFVGFRVALSQTSD